MIEPFRYDRVVKDVCLHDKPAMLERVTGGRRIVEFGNVELPRTIERRADLVLMLAGGEVHHLELQAQNRRKLPYRQGVHCFLLAERYVGRSIGQTVIYIGEPRMTMASGVNVGAGTVKYQLMDIRDIHVDEMLSYGRPGDLVLAALAGQGKENLRKILSRIHDLPPDKRTRALTQVAILAGLRSMEVEFKMEMKRMGVAIDIRKNLLVRECLEEAKAEGREEGREAGREEAAGEILITLLDAKFGKLPVWAAVRIRRATAAQRRDWTRRVLKAESLHEVLGRR